MQFLSERFQFFKVTPFGDIGCAFLYFNDEYIIITVSAVNNDIREYWAAICFSMTGTIMRKMKFFNIVSISVIFAIDIVLATSL